jgi:sigma-B regulation protein RsbU (phosphoserine phosphatase)
MKEMTKKQFETDGRFAQLRSRYLTDFYEDVRSYLHESGMAVLIYHRLRMELEVHLYLTDRMQTFSLRDIAPTEFEEFGSNDDRDSNPIFRHFSEVIGYCPLQTQSYAFEAASHISVLIYLFARERLDALQLFIDSNLQDYTLKLQNAILRDALNRSRLELQLLQETGEILSMSFRLDDVFKGIAAALQKLHPFDALGIFILAKKAQVIEEIFSVGYPSEGSRDLLANKAGKGLVGWVSKTGEPVIVPNVDEDPRYIRTRTQTKSELVVPLFSGGEVIGAFNLESNQLDAYSPSDLEMVTAFANQASFSITRARLYRDTAAKNRIEDQLEVARQIQKSFLPATMPKYPGFDMDAINISSEQVGGDYFDFIPIVDHQLGIPIADVSGKGLPASLIMASFRASLIAEIRNNYAIRTIMRKVNNLICESVERGSFVTAVYGVLDTKNRIFTFTNAGHNPPFILRRTGEVEFLTSGGLILGIMPERQYEERPVQVSAGDILVMYTDGVTDTENDKTEQVGIDLLVEWVRENRGLSARQIREKIVAEILKFRAADIQPDDLTLIVIKAE